MDGPASGGGRQRRRKLTRSAEFERVYRHGRSKANRFLALYAFPREDESGEGPRLGLSAAAAGTAHPVDEFGQRPPHAAGPLALREALGVRACDHHIVRAGGKALGLLPERLAQDALHARAVDGATDAARHGEAQARPLVRSPLARERVEHEEPVGLGAALPVDALELGASRQPSPAPPTAARGVGH